MFAVMKDSDYATKPKIHQELLGRLESNTWEEPYDQEV
jgi:hypothetical protein